MKDDNREQARRLLDEAVECLRETKKLVSKPRGTRRRPLIRKSFLVQFAIMDSDHRRASPLILHAVDQWEIQHGGDICDVQEVSIADAINYLIEEYTGPDGKITAADAYNAARVRDALRGMAQRIDNALVPPGSPMSRRVALGQRLKENPNGQ